jgi:hypothetical protein
VVASGPSGRTIRLARSNSLSSTSPPQGGNSSPTLGASGSVSSVDMADAANDGTLQQAEALRANAAANDGTLQLQLAEALKANAALQREQDAERARFALTLESGGKLDAAAVCKSVVSCVC